MRHVDLQIQGRKGGRSDASAKVTTRNRFKLIFEGLRVLEGADHASRFPFRPTAVLAQELLGLQERRWAKRVYSTAGGRSEFWAVRLFVPLVPGTRL